LCNLLDIRGWQLLPLAQRNNTNPPLGIRLYQAKIEFRSQSIRGAAFAQATEMILDGISNKSGSTTIKSGDQDKRGYDWDGKACPLGQAKKPPANTRRGICPKINLAKTYD
jgi:hypothetical protein